MKMRACPKTIDKPLLILGLEGEDIAVLMFCFGIPAILISPAIPLGLILAAWPALVWFKRGKPEGYVLHALYRIGLRTEASREWVWTVRTMDDRRLLAAAELARCNKIWDCAINTADRTVFAHDFSMRYLTPYHDVLSKQARARQIEEMVCRALVDMLDGRTAAASSHGEDK